MWIGTLVKKWWTGYLIGALAVVCAILYLRFARPTPPAYDPTPQPVQTAKEPRVVTRTVTKVVKVPGPPRIVYLDKPETVNALKMPELLDVPDNVLAVASVPPSGERPVTVVSTLSPEGEGRIEYRMEPQKFFQVKKEFGIRAGIGTGNVGIAEVYGRPLRLGPVTVEVRGWVQRTDRDGGDGGGAVLLDYRF